MSDNNDGKIVLGLDMPKTVSQINKDIKRLESQLKQIKATGALDTSSTVKKINAQISSLQAQLKNINIKANIDNANAHKAGRKLGQTVADAAQQTINDNGINTDKLSADIKTLLNSLNSFSTKNTGFDSFKTDINGAEVSLESLIAKLGTVNNVSELNTLRSQANALKTSFTELAQAQDIRHKIDVGDYETKILTYQTSLKRLGLSADEITSKMKSVNTAFGDLKVSATADKMIPGTVVANAQKLDTEMQKISNTVKGLNLKDSLRADDVQVEQTIIRLNNQLKKNSNYTKQAKKNIHDWIVELERGDVAHARLREINVSAKQLHAHMREINRVGKSFYEQLSSKIGSLSSLFSAATLLSRAATMVKDGIHSVKELDTSLVDLKKTTTMSAKQLQEFYYDSNETAKQMGVTTNAIIEQASAWSRLGFSGADAATRMAKYSSQFASISPGMDVNEATTSLVSIIKAFDIDSNDILDGVMSKINDVGNKFATSNAEIAEGLRNSSAAMAAVGGTLEDNIALFTAGQEIIQDASQVGNAIRSITLRIRGYDEETQELSDDLVDVSGKVADLTKVESNGNHGISLFTDSSQKEFKSLVTYLGEVSDIWDELDQKTQNDLLEKLFGKNRAQVGAAILENFDAVRDSLEAMGTSAGSADRELSIAMDSVDYKLNRLKETGTGIAQNLFGRQDMKTVLDIFSALANGLDALTEKIGLFGTLGLGGGLLASFKNVGRDKMFSLMF